MTFTVNCSKGTYIRTLCHDIGQKVGCGGAMESLLRTRVDRFTLEEAYTLSEIEVLRDKDAISDILISVEEMFPSYQKVTVKNAFRKVIDNGNSVFSMMCEEQLQPVVEGKNPVRIRVYNEDGLFYGIYEYHFEKECFIPYKMFLDREHM